MDTLWAFGFAFVVGLTICGLAGTLMELVSGTRLRMTEPFVSRQRPGLSLVASAAAGPYMMLNDALAARRDGRIGVRGVAAALATATIWTLSTGILATELAIRLAGG